jgi:hypothetical protein
VRDLAFLGDLRPDADLGEKIFQESMTYAKIKSKCSLIWCRYLWGQSSICGIETTSAVELRKTALQRFSLAPATLGAGGSRSPLVGLI